MTTSEYTIRLDAFEGPLDLLLFLIRRAEVEITDIPIARITEQYLLFLDEFTRSARPIDIENAGEFLVMAATLVEIKSRTLAPPPTRQRDGNDGEDAQGPRSKRDDDGDPRTALVRQLLEYKRFRDAAEHLERWRDEHSRKYESARAGIMQAPAQEQDAQEDEPLVEVEDLHLIDLVEAFARIMQTVDFTRVGEHRVVFDDTPVEVHAEDILDQLRRLAERDAQGQDAATPRLVFSALFRDRTRSEAIGLFLAMLELIKQRRVAIRHESADDPTQITLELAEPEASSSAQQPVPSAADAGASAGAV